MYPKYWNTLTPYHTCPKKLKKSILLSADVSDSAGQVANSVDHDQMLQNVASDLGLHCLLRPVLIFWVIMVSRIKSHWVLSHINT